LGKRAVSASDDNTVKIWDLETGEVIATFTCDSPAFCCAYSDAVDLILAATLAATFTSSALKNRKRRAEQRRPDRYLGVIGSWTITSPTHRQS
jgi:WD40 repeat protein